MLYDPIRVIRIDDIETLYLFHSDITAMKWIEQNYPLRRCIDQSRGHYVLPDGGALSQFGSQVSVYKWTALAT